jgi:REP-associated tyrosine transposase
MSQSLVQNYVHVVFSTKNREPFIDTEIEEELYAYMISICDSLESTVIQIGGYNDHVHILCSLSRKIALMKLLEEVKSHSSKWIKPKGEKYENFYWQHGYGAFSVSSKDLNKVINYIKNQKKHHSQHSFQDEYKLLLKDKDMEYDERYVWD